LGTYPIDLNLGGRRCLIVGGGKVAARKARSLLQAEAKVEVLSPTLCAELAELARSGRIRYICGVYHAGCLDSYFLVICATNRRGINQLAAKEAARNGALVNVVDDERAGNFTVPASTRRGDLLFTISTGGKSPALARRLRQDLENTYGEAFAVYLTLVEKARRQLKEKTADSRARENFWRAAIGAHTIDLLKQGNIKQAEAELNDAITGFGAES